MKYFLVIVLTMLVHANLSAVAADLTVYTYQSFVTEWGPGPILEERFEAQCECDLALIGLEDGVALLNRLRIEGAKTPADLVLGLDDALIAETRRLNLLANHGLDLSGLALPYAWDDAQFVPYDYGHFAFIYDSSRISDVPESLRALVEDSELSIIYQDPRISTPGQGLLLWVKSIYGEEAAAAWRKLSDKTLTITPGWSEAYALFLQGKGDLVLSYLTSPAYHMTHEATEKYQAAAFSEGHYAQIEVAAALQSSPNLALAKDFLAFLISPAAQDVLAATNWMWPVLPGASTPEAYAKLHRPTSLNFSSEEVAAERKAWLREWRNAVSQ